MTTPTFACPAQEAADRIRVAEERLVAEVRPLRLAAARTIRAAAAAGTLVEPCR